WCIDRVSWLRQHHRVAEELSHFHSEAVENVMESIAKVPRHSTQCNFKILAPTTINVIAVIALIIPIILYATLKLFTRLSEEQWVAFWTKFAVSYVLANSCVGLYYLILL